MRGLVVCLGAGVAFGLGSVWALLENEEPARPVRPVVEASAVGTPMVAEDRPRHNASTDSSEAAAKPVDPALVGGYSGTAVIRAGGSTSAQKTKQPPKVRDEAPTWLPGRNVMPVDSQLPAVAKALAASPKYCDALMRLYQLGSGKTLVTLPKAGPRDWVYETRFQREPVKLAQLLFSAFAQSSGAARQNIIFQTALALPDRLCLPWLRDLQAGADIEDAQDALCALAFRGEPDSMAAFESLAAMPAPDSCRILADSYGDHDELAAQGKRGILRSYRCIETLDCRPYFQLHSWYCGRAAGSEFPWADRYALATVDKRREIARRLLPCWLTRFGGHPGSDDMAWRLCCDCKERQQWLDAARWASRCAAFPDQDMTAHGVAELVTLCETAMERWQVVNLCVAETRLDPWQVEGLLYGQDYARNRELLKYILLRRTAVDTGFDAALRDAAAIASSEPSGLIAVCFRARWASPVAKGLDSGVNALPADDPLRRVDQIQAPESNYLNPVNYWVNWHHMAGWNQPRDEEQRMNPPPEAVQLPGDRLCRQFRLWETLAELERRRDRAIGGVRADLTYKIGAVYYHENNSIYPCYAKNMSRSGLPEDVAARWRWADEIDKHEETPDRAAQAQALRRKYAPLARAADIFEGLALERPAWPGRDKALFSAAKARIKLVDYRPFDDREERDFDIRAGVELFERLAHEHPSSNLADDAERAAAYWRRVRKHLWP